MAANYTPRDMVLYQIWVFDEPAPGPINKYEITPPELRVPDPPMVEVVRFFQDLATKYDKEVLNSRPWPCFQCPKRRARGLLHTLRSYKTDRPEPVMVDLVLPICRNGSKCFKMAVKIMAGDMRTSSAQTPDESSLASAVGDDRAHGDAMAAHRGGRDGSQEYSRSDSRDRDSTRRRGRSSTRESPSKRASRSRGRRHSRSCGASGSQPRSRSQCRSRSRSASRERSRPGKDDGEEKKKRKRRNRSGSRERKRSKGKGKESVAEEGIHRRPDAGVRSATGVQTRSRARLAAVSGDLS